LYFWRVGYAGYWQLGKRRQAFEAFGRGIRLRPLDRDMLATISGCLLKALVGRQPRPTP
jgi:hypothetical protein